MRLQYLLAFTVIVTSCTNSERMSEKVRDAGIDQNGMHDRQDNWLILQQRFIKEREHGADFIAFGKNPDWQIVLNSNNDVSLITKSDFGTFGAPNLEVTKAPDLNGVTYGAKTTHGTISLMVFSDSCMAQKEGLLPNRVKISISKAENDLTEFTGCGLYLNNPALNDIWALKSWSSLSSGQNLPVGAYLEFNLQSNRIYGILGCGEITGYFSPMGSRIEIFKLGYVDKDCTEELIAMQLFNTLNFSTYKLIYSGSQLQLINDSDTISFIKAD